MLSKVATISVSAADDTTFFKMVLAMQIDLLGLASSGFVVLLVRKKKPAILL